MSGSKVPFDQFGTAPKFNIRGSETAKTWVGFLLTVLYISTVLILFIYSLVLLGERAEPVTNNEEGFEEDPPFTDLS
jgi:hypothetical protein